MSEEEMSRRERQIMRIIYRIERGTVQEVSDEMDEDLSLNTVRSLIQILEKKGHLQREKKSREFIYSPTVNRGAAGLDALQSVLETFFENSLGNALASHFSQKVDSLSPEEYEKVASMIEDARKDEQK